MVVHNYYPYAETRVQREAEALVEQGFEVDILCLRAKGDAPEESYRSVHVYRLPIRRLKGNLAIQLLNYLHFFLFAAVKLAVLQPRRRYDAIQVHNLPDFLVFCALVPKLRGVPVILDLHDLMPEFYSGKFGGGRASWLLRLVRWQEKLACRFADHVITVSEHWRQALIQRGVPPDKCSVVMNVADERIFHPMPLEKPRSDDEFRLIYHGTIVKRYGLDLVVQAMDRLRDDIPGLRLILVGQGDLVPVLKEMVQELGLSERVTFEPPRVAEELPPLILSADVGIVPYRNDPFTDGLLPTKLMEYAALGLPSIAGRTTAIQAYFPMVMFFTPGDVDELARCIKTFYNDQELLRQYAEKIQQFNLKYNWTTLKAEYAALVRRVAQKSEVEG